VLPCSGQCPSTTFGVLDLYTDAAPTRAETMPGKSMHRVATFVTLWLTVLGIQLWSMG
jgi:hypothetical protein